MRAITLQSKSRAALITTKGRDRPGLRGNLNSIVLRASTRPAPADVATPSAPTCPPATSHPTRALAVPIPIQPQHLPRHRSPRPLNLGPRELQWWRLWLQWRQRCRRLYPSPNLAAPFLRRLSLPASPRRADSRPHPVAEPCIRLDTPAS